MPLGGVHVVLPAPAGECLGDIILRACRWHWPGERCFFQDAEDEDHVYPLDDPWVWTTGAASKEFFIYKNEEAVKAWTDGPTRSNANTMLHFLIGEPLAVVCDKITPDIRHLIDALRTSFSSLVQGTLRRGAA
jgi:hypothetical protein